MVVLPTPPLPIVMITPLTGFGDVVNQIAEVYPWQAAQRLAAQVNLEALVPSPIQKACVALECQPGCGSAAGLSSGGSFSLDNGFAAFNAPAPRRSSVERQRDQNSQLEKGR